MNFIVFMLFSCLETSAMYFLMFRLFKIEIQIEIPRIIYCSLMASCVSYTMREVFHLSSLDVMLQLLLLFLSLWLVFRVHIFYAGLMAEIGLITYLAMQMLLYFCLNVFEFIPNVPDSTGFSTYVLQILSVLCAVCLGWLVGRRNKGFDFVPHSTDVSVQLKGRNRLLVLLYIPAFVPLTLIYYFAQVNANFIFIPLALSLASLSLLYWSYKRDRVND